MSKRKWLLLSIVLVVLMTGGYLVDGIYTKIQRKNVLQRSLRTLPVFQFMALDSTIVGPEYIQVGQPTVLLFFSPDCEYCQAQAQSIAQHLNMLNDIQFLWIADDSMSVVHAFADRYGIDHKPNSKVVTAPVGQIKTLFGIGQLPTTLIYDQQQRFVRQFSGETKWEAIFAAVNDQ